MKAGWSVRDVAKAAGRSVGHVAEMARTGLLPGYVGSDRRKSAEIPADLAEACALVLRAGACTPRFAAVMREDPETALATAEAMATLARAAVEARDLEEGKAA